MELRRDPRKHPDAEALRRGDAVDGDLASLRQPVEDALTNANIRLHGAILHVESLFRAIDFYTRLLDLQVTRRTSDAAVLASPAGVSTIALHERRGQHFTDRTVQALVWHVPTLEAFSQVEQRLQHLSSNVVKHTVNEPLTLLSTRDPDGQRLVFIHYDGVEDMPRDIPAAVFWY